MYIHIYIYIYIYIYIHERGREREILKIDSLHNSFKGEFQDAIHPLTFPIVLGVQPSASALFEGMGSGPLPFCLGTLCLCLYPRGGALHVLLLLFSSYYYFV